MFSSLFHKDCSEYMQSSVARTSTSPLSTLYTGIVVAVVVVVVVVIVVDNDDVRHLFISSCYFFLLFVMQAYENIWHSSC